MPSLFSVGDSVKFWPFALEEASDENACVGLVTQVVDAERARVGGFTHAALLTAIGAGLGRIAKAFDDTAAAFNRMGEKHEGEERELVRLGGAIAEARADTAEAKDAAREARDTVIERVGPRRIGRRVATNSSG